MLQKFELFYHKWSKFSLATRISITLSVSLVLGILFFGILGSEFVKYLKTLTEERTVSILTIIGFCFFSLLLMLVIAFGQNITSLIGKALRDPLIEKAYSKKFLLDRWPAIVAHAKRYQERITVIFIDLDKLKPINDSSGHECGNMALRTIADIIASMIRQEDTFVRYGGDEFIVVLSQTEDADCDDIAMRFESRLSAESKICFEYNGQIIHLSASVGVVKTSYSDVTTSIADLEHLMKKADEHMYRRKNISRQLRIIEDVNHLQ